MKSLSKRGGAESVVKNGRRKSDCSIFLRSPDIEHAAWVHDYCEDFTSHLMVDIRNKLFIKSSATELAYQQTYCQEFSAESLVYALHFMQSK